MIDLAPELLRATNAVGWSSQEGNSNYSRLRWRSIKGYEAMHMLKKGQVKIVEKGAVREWMKFIAKI